MNNTKDRLQSQSVFASLLWKFLERGSVQVIQFIIGILIARLLTPAEYGDVALLTVFITIASVFVQSGLNTALIQKKEADTCDFSSVFYYSILIALVLYILLYYFAPTIASFYNSDYLCELLRIMSLTLFPGAVNSIQIAYLSKNMLFKPQFYSSFLAAFVSGIVGVSMAFYGYGAWSLVFQQLMYQVAICIILLVIVKWHPTFEFSFSRTKSLLNFGSKLLLANLIDTTYRNLESLVLGKFFSTNVLSYCNKGKQFPLVAVTNIDGSIQSVMLPAYSKYQHDLDNLRSLLRQSVSLSTYVVFPCMVLLAVVSPSLISLLLGDAWMGTVPYLILYCIFCMFFPLQTTILQAINAIGRSDKFLVVRTVKHVLGILLLVVSVIMFKSPFAIVISSIVVEIIGSIVVLPISYNLLGYGIRSLIADIKDPLLLSLVMLLFTYPLSYFNLSDIALLCIQSLVGILVYILFSHISKNTSYIYIYIRFFNK